MKNRYLTAWKFLSVALFIIAGATMNMAQNDVIPYIYYYSSSDAAFMMERADGTDQQILAEFELTGEAIIGPGWSTSGRWLAWTVNSSTDQDAQAMIFDRSTGKVFDILPVQGDVLALDWSSNGDFLLIQFIQDNTNGYAQYVIVDVAEQSIILHIDNTLLAYDDYLPSIYQVTMQWTPSGRYAVLYHPSPSIGNPNLYNMRIYSFNGQEIFNREIMLNYVGSQLPQQCLPQWSEKDFVAYIESSGERLIIENLESGSSISLASEIDTVGVFDWSPSGDRAFLYRNRFCSGQEVGDLAILDINDANLTQVLDSVLIPESYHDKFPFSFDTMVKSVWSPDSKYGVFADENGSVFIVSGISGDTVQITTPLQSPRVVTRSINWISINQFRFVVQDTSNGDYYVLKYDLSTLDTEIEVRFSRNGYNFVFSNLPEYFLFSSIDCEGACVINLIDNHLSNIVDEWTPLIYSETAPVPFFELFLHPNEPWTFLTSQRYSGMYRSLYVANFNGDSVREIGSVYLAPSSFGWFPRQQN